MDLRFYDVLICFSDKNMMYSNPSFRLRYWLFYIYFMHYLFNYVNSNQYIQLLGCRTNLRDVNGERVKLKVGLASDDMVSHIRGGQNLRIEPNRVEPNQPNQNRFKPNQSLFQIIRLKIFPTRMVRFGSV